MVALLEDDEPEAIRNFTSRIHPLLIDHVVHKILVYASECEENEEASNSKGIHNDLLSYRLVCRLWNEIASSLYRSRKHVEVGSYSISVPKFRRLIKLRKENPHCRTAKKLNKSLDSKTLFSSSPPWPCAFTKFRLCQELFQPIYASVITDFFQTFQDSLEVLDVWLDLRSTLALVSFQRNKACHKCCFPNLKTLIYDDRRVVLQGSEDLRGILLKDLTQLAPNLEHLNIRFQRNYRGSLESSSGALLSSINEVFSCKSIQSRLKYLKMDLHMNNDVLGCLTSSCLRLDTLEVAIRGSVFSFLAFRQFLESLQLYLKKLKLSYIERDSNCLISFPKMFALRELEIDGTDAFSKHSVAFADFTYNDNLPQLQALRVNIWATVNLRWSQFFQRKPPVGHLAELKLPGELCDRSTLHTAATVFPNLKKLHISVYSSTLDSMEVVFQYMSQLQELTVMKFPSLWDRNEKNIDFIFTGISEEECDSLCNNNVTLERITEEKLAELKTKPGIKDLKELRKFVMPDLQYQASYTDITGYLAFLRMHNLKYLNVGRSHLGCICLKEIVNKFPEMETQRRITPTYYKELDDDDEASFLELPGDTCVYL